MCFEVLSFATGARAVFSPKLFGRKGLAAQAIDNIENSYPNEQDENKCKGQYQTNNRDSNKGYSGKNTLKKIVHVTKYSVL